MEERRGISTLQETFTIKLAEISETKTLLKIHLKQNEQLINDVRQSQKDVQKAINEVEKNSLRIEQIKKEHLDCAARVEYPTFKDQLGVIASKVSIIMKVGYFLVAGLIASLYKIFFSNI